MIMLQTRRHCFPVRIHSTLDLDRERGHGHAVKLNDRHLEKSRYRSADGDGHREDARSLDRMSTRDKGRSRFDGDRNDRKDESRISKNVIHEPRLEVNHRQANNRDSRRNFDQGHHRNIERGFQDASKERDTRSDRKFAREHRSEHKHADRQARIDRPLEHSNRSQGRRDTKSDFIVERDNARQSYSRERKKDERKSPEHHNDAKPNRGSRRKSHERNLRISRERTNNADKEWKRNEVQDKSTSDLENHDLQHKSRRKEKSKDVKTDRSSSRQKDSSRNKSERTERSDPDASASAEGRKLSRRQSRDREKSKGGRKSEKKQKKKKHSDPEDNHEHRKSHKKSEDSVKKKKKKDKLESKDADSGKSDKCSKKKKKKEKKKKKSKKTKKHTYESNEENSNDEEYAPNARKDRHSESSSEDLRHTLKRKIPDEGETRASASNKKKPSSGTRRDADARQSKDDSPRTDAPTRTVFVVKNDLAENRSSVPRRNDDDLGQNASERTEERPSHDRVRAACDKDGDAGDKLDRYERHREDRDHREKPNSHFGDDSRHRGHEGKATGSWRGGRKRPMPADTESSAKRQRGPQQALAENATDDPSGDRVPVHLRLGPVSGGGSGGGGHRGPKKLTGGKRGGKNRGVTHFRKH